MSTPVLLLRLEGPLQSWGQRARWDVRDTAREPTKSGVIGLLASALGYERDDPRIATELDAGLRMGVRVEWEAELIVDYHTVNEFLPMADGGFKGSNDQRAKTLARLLRDPDAQPYTVVSTRRYLADGAFLVALTEFASESSALLDRCAAALREPAWPYFLGRRTCIPTRPVLEGLLTGYASIEDALTRHPWSFLGPAAADRQQRAEFLRVVIEDAGALPSGVEASAPVMRDDRREIGTARLYGRRFVRESYVANPGPKVAEGT
jgi:CRISPR system Cascade subunit CasD